MTEPATQLLSHLKGQSVAIFETLKELVELESPSSDKAALDRFSERLAGLWQAAGAQVEVLRQGRAGNHLLVHVPGMAKPSGASGTDAEKPLLLLGHMDTVWEVGELARRPVRVEGDRAYGPGINDMKGGHIQALYAVKALQALGRGPRRPLTILCNSDEETGSHTSRPFIEAEARKSEAVLVLEPPNDGDGSLKTWRKGVGAYQVKAVGRAAHAGADPEKGISAIHELAHQVIALQALNRPDSGTTVNVGVIRGGTRSNVIPAEATASVDVRVMNQAEGERIDKAIRALRPVLPGGALEITGGLNRPPMEPSAGNLALYEKARTLAAELGFEIAAGGTGGGSDGNFTAALGLPTLDGLGAYGDGGHAVTEHVVVSALPIRAALLARLLETL
ncbi:MAG: M20 family metallopeptidase [Bacillota bacterium]